MVFIAVVLATIIHVVMLAMAASLDQTILRAIPRPVMPPLIAAFTILWIAILDWTSEFEVFHYDFQSQVQQTGTPRPQGSPPAVYYAPSTKTRPLTTPQTHANTRATQRRRTRKERQLDVRKYT